MKEQTSDASGRAGRRRALLAGATALAAGLGMAWWQRQTAQPTSERVDASLWQYRFARPEGGEIVMRSLRGRPLLINFWATWCPPCIDELPLLDRFSREQAASGWQVLGLAVDRVEAVQNFLRQHPLGFAIGVAGMDGLALARQLGDQAGGLPFTVLLAPDGHLLRRKMGKLTLQDLYAWSHSPQP